jgi:hypothetical protein
MAEQSTQDPEELRQDTAHETDPPSGPPLTERQRKILFRLLRVAYPHDRFPDAPYERTAKQVEDATEDIAALAEGLDALGEEFLALDETAVTEALREVDQQAFFRAIHSTTVVALYDDREVWDLLGYEGSSFDKGGYIDRGFDDLDWLPDPRITESAEPRVELVTDEAAR